MAHILVIGASRGIGLETVRRALAEGWTVRAFARSAPGIEIDDPNLEKCAGDAVDAADVAAALDGVDAVVQALGVPQGPDFVLKPVRLFSEATRILLPAMTDAQVDRLVSVTGFGAGDSQAHVGCLQRVPFRLLLGRAYDDKTRQEAMIRHSDRDWTIVRPGILTRGRRSGRYRVLTSPDQWRNGFVSRADVADFIVRCIADGSHSRQTPVIIR